VTALEHDWFPASLPANVEVGEGTWLYSSYAFLHYRSRAPLGLRIGRSCGIYINTMFEIGEDGIVEIGDHCTLSGPILSTNGRLTIGDHVLMSSRVVVCDEPFARPDGDGPGATTEIGDLVWVGTRVVIAGGTRIGEGAVIGAGTVVTEDVPARAIVAGAPARIVGTVPERREA
jgi:acetyltransferase-like isoleucine patch superfamily enzyme